MIPTTEYAIALFKQRASEYLVLPVLQLPKLLEELGMYPLHPFFTAHIQGDILTLSQFVKIVEKVSHIDAILERFLDRFGSEKAITMDDLVHLFERKGEEFTMPQIEAFFRESDGDNDGVINLADLKRILGIASNPRMAAEAEADSERA